jgi:hypothetical protein
MTVILEGYDQGDGQGAWVPNWFVPNYDVLYVTVRLYILSKSEIMKICLAFMMNIENVNTVDSIIPVYFNPKTGYRPRLDKLNQLPNANPLIFLKSSLIQTFMKKPDNGKIVTLGEV